VPLTINGGVLRKLLKKNDKTLLCRKGSAVVGQMAAALAVGSIVLKNDTYLRYAKKYFELADATRSDSTYTAANGFYSSTADSGMSCCGFHLALSCNR